MYYFLVYDDGTHTEYINKLLESVKIYGPQFEIIRFQKSDMDPEFVSLNSNILTQKRGGGYWLWKPYIIYNILQKINENDIVFYLDSKYYFIEEFSELYSEPLKTRDILVWKNQPNTLPEYFMKNWCKMDVIMKYGLYDKVFKYDAEDSWAGAIIVKKTPSSMIYIKEWLDLCCIYENITDTPSIIWKNSPEFNEHRHDQSMLSIMLHKNNIPLELFKKRYLQNCRRPYEL